MVFVKPHTTAFFKCFGGSVFGGCKPSAGIAAEHERFGMALWNTLCNGESSPRYPNQGTLVHWAVWCQHWDIITMAAAGADLTVRKGFVDERADCR